MNNTYEWFDMNGKTTNFENSSLLSTQVHDSSVNMMLSKIYSDKTNSYTDCCIMFNGSKISTRLLIKRCAWMVGILMMLFCTQAWTQKQARDKTEDKAQNKAQNKIDQSHSSSNVAQSSKKTTRANKFWFGSYGRVGFSSNLDGGEGQKRQITAYAPRLIEDNYLELDWGYWVHRSRNAQVKTVFTLAFFDQFFHYNGQNTTTTAIRRAFLEAEKLWGTSLWMSVGSRWLRGNDIYLMNFWPLDDLNSMGLTVGTRGTRHEGFLHIGFNRLANDKQQQYVAVPAASQFGAEEILFLNRQRLLLAALYERRYLQKSGWGWKWKIYGEYHYLPAGERALEGSYTEVEALSDDQGVIAGVQLGLWGLGHSQNHLNLWARYTRGLANFDELGMPSSVDLNQRSWLSQEWRVALAGNWTTGNFWSVQWGSYLRSYQDADHLTVDFDDRVEGSFVVRPQLQFGIFTPAIEASVQWSQAQDANPQDLSVDAAQIHQLAFMPSFTFDDKKTMGSFSRPQIRLIYAISWLNQAALARYAYDDPRSQAKQVHYIGTRAEWWFGRGGGY